MILFCMQFFLKKNQENIIFMEVLLVKYTAQLFSVFDRDRLATDLSRVFVYFCCCCCCCRRVVFLVLLPHSGLQIWGGENYELAFKLWQCGGRSVWVPCSRIGHVYRGHSCSSCHSGGVDQKWGGVPLAMRNYKRLVETWFDPKYKEYFYTREPLAKFIDMGDISEQLALKKRKNCKSFTWFMTEIAYDVFDKYPPPPPNKHWGEIRNVATGLCIDTLGRSPTSRIGTSSCHGYGGNQLWRLNAEGQLASGEWCVAYRKAERENENEMVMEWCQAGDVSGPWQYVDEDKYFRHRDSGKCLVIHTSTLKLTLADCQKQIKHHQWEFKEITPSWARKH